MTQEQWCPERTLVSHRPSKVHWNPDSQRRSIALVAAQSAPAHSLPQSVRSAFRVGFACDCFRSSIRDTGQLPGPFREMDLSDAPSRSSSDYHSPPSARYLRYFLSKNDLITSLAFSSVSYTSLVVSRMTFNVSLTVLVLLLGMSCYLQWNRSAYETAGFLDTQEMWRRAKTTRLSLETPLKKRVEAVPQERVATTPRSEVKFLEIPLGAPLRGRNVSSSSRTPKLLACAAPRRRQQPARATPEAA